MKIYLSIFMISFFFNSYATDIQTKVIDSNEDSGRFNAIVVDSKGYSHIVYQDYNNNRQILKYAYQDKNGWHIETIDQSDKAGYYADIAISGDTLHVIEIIKTSDSLNKLRYLQKLPSSSIWLTQELNDYDYYQYAKICVDYKGTPNIIFGAQNSGDSEYSLVRGYRNEANYWQVYDVITTNVEQHMNWYANCDIAMRETVYGNEIVSYFEQDKLMLCEGNSYTVIDDNTGRGYGSSVAYDEHTGSVWIAYHDRNSDQLKVAQKINNYLNIFSIDNTGCMHPVLTLDHHGNPHIIYYTGRNSDQKHLRYAYMKDGGWYKETIDQGFDSRLVISGITINSNNQARISYYWNDNLYFAKDIQQYVSVKKQESISNEFELFSCYPNPFNPLINICFGLEANSFVIIKVYSASGQLVNILTQETLNAGQHALQWNGTNQQGHLVSSGVYLIKIQTNQSSVSQKILFLQ